MINVVCVKWGDLYSADYVNKLYNSIKRNTTHDFKFICFTEDTNGIDKEIECRAFPFSQLVGWWNKMSLFSPEANLQGRVLYFDLDTVIVDNIDEYFEFKGTFAILQDLYRVEKKVDETAFGSAIMAWENGSWAYKIWEQFASQMAANSQHAGGDQRYLMKTIQLPDVTFWQKFLKRTKVGSYKIHIRDKEPKGQLPANRSIICFHGKPRPVEVASEPFMIEYWK